MLEVPPLRYRKEDIPTIASATLNELGVEWENGALTPLNQFDWPGNVRQLKNLLIRTLVNSPSKKIQEETLKKICHEEFARLPSDRAARLFHEGSLADIEKEAIVYRLSRYDGNRKRTAEDLGIAKSTLHDKLRRWSHPRFDLPAGCGLGTH